MASSDDEVCASWKRHNLTKSEVMLRYTTIGTRTVREDKKVLSLRFVIWKVRKT